VVAVKIYVEGGGDRKDLKVRCRAGFRQFIEKAGLCGRMPRIIACGGRRSAYDDFCTALSIAGANEFIVLLVDSEDPVDSGTDPWVHLNSRQGDGWIKPSGAIQDNAHLMVQCMETWFLADKEALKEFYGQGFIENSLPANPNIEQVHRADVLSGLENASRSTSKGKYNKGNHSILILSRFDPFKVQAASEYADRLIKMLNEKLL
jgi:hypothetical protein